MHAIKCRVGEEARLIFVRAGLRAKRGRLERLADVVVVAIEVRDRALDSHNRLDAFFQAIRHFIG